MKEIVIKWHANAKGEYRLEELNYSQLPKKAADQIDES